MKTNQNYSVTIASLAAGCLSGTIQAAASKSSMQRACAAALVANGMSIIKNPGHSNDDHAALDIIKQLGALVEFRNGDLIIISSINQRGVLLTPPDDSINAEINCGESGLSIRMFTPLAALSNRITDIVGSGSLLTRPMDFFDEILPQLGVSVSSNKGKLPLRIKGPILPKTITIDGSLSSQFLTGLLLAFSASGASDVSIKVNNLKSKPYIDLTLDVMKQFGLKVPANKDYEEFYFQSTPNDSQLATSGTEPPIHHYTVEGDWSGAAFLLVAGAIAGPIVVKGLDVHSTQADKVILKALIDCGIGISIEPDAIELRPKSMNAFHFNATDCPDLFPPLVALAAFCKGKSVIEGVKRLAHKESDRGSTLQEEFGKMGVKIELQNDLMIVEGGDSVHGARVHSHHDHRIAMACAVAALKATGETIIEEAGAVNKSYPDFYDHLRKLGASVSLPHQLIN
ncbi:MAG: 3-phosphoshikimate 1-carboxyvinyltransferase [Chitinophagaceae bacterium]